MRNGYYLHGLQRVNVEGGDVLHALTCLSENFHGFGEAYFSTIHPGAIKAWKLHTKMTMNLIVPVGNVRFVFPELENECVQIGEDAYQRLCIYPGTWFGFQGLGKGSSLILNIADIVHHPDESQKVEKQIFDFDWNTR